jgi:uncharacterized protein YbbK (DUF523 family)
MDIVSACLVGVRCNYKGGCKTNAKLLAEYEKGGLYPICPEVMGGLEIPRHPAECTGSGLEVLSDRAKVVDSRGYDVTRNFVKGAFMVLDIAKTVKAEKAILKSKSPSCGCGRIFDGSFTDTLVERDGVTAALLKKSGLKVLTECDF